MNLTVLCIDGGSIMIEYKQEAPQVILLEDEPCVIIEED